MSYKKREEKKVQIKGCELCKNRNNIDLLEGFTDHYMTVLGNCALFVNKKLNIGTTNFKRIGYFTQNPVSNKVARLLIEQCH